VITIVLLAAFIILSKIFSPIWLLLLALVMLWPYRRNKSVRATFLLAILLFILYFLFQYFAVLIPFLIGLGIAYILAPVVDFLERKKIPRIFAILMLVLPITAIIPLVAFLVISGLLAELQGLIEKFPSIIQDLQMYTGTFINRLAELGIEIDPNVIANTITTHLTRILTGIFATIGQIGKGIGSIIIILYNLVLIPLSAYLFLSDREVIAGWFKHLFGIKERNRIESFIERLNVSLARFFRGTLLLMLIVGTIVGFSLWILGIKYYVLLGVIAGASNLIPNVGYILSLIPALFIGITSPNPLLNTVKIIAVFAGEQLLENLFLGPMIIGKASKLHPVVVMVVLILGSLLFGFWGAVIAVPFTIFAREFLNHFLGLQL
jgi:predicted PurR-regulated permease PerM